MYSHVAIQIKPCVCIGTTSSSVVQDITPQGGSKESSMFLRLANEDTLQNGNLILSIEIHAVV